MGKSFQNGEITKEDLDFFFENWRYLTQREIKEKLGWSHSIFAKIYVNRNNPEKVYKLLKSD